MFSAKQMEEERTQSLINCHVFSIVHHPVMCQMIMKAPGDSPVLFLIFFSRLLTLSFSSEAVAFLLSYFKKLLT